MFRRSSRRSTSGRGDGSRTDLSRADGSVRSGGWIPSAAAGRSNRSVTSPMRTSPRCSRARRSRRRRSRPVFRRLRCDGRGWASSSPTAAGRESGSTPGWIFTPRMQASMRSMSGGWLPACTASTSQGTVGLDPWYTEPVGATRWAELVTVLRARHAPFADELDSLLPELVAMEAYLGGPPRDLRTCHRDLWADNLRRAQTAACVSLTSTTPVWPTRLRSSP